MNNPVKRSQVQCLNCKTWLDNPFQLGSRENFEAASMFGNILTCPVCNANVPCNAENMRWVQVDGNAGFAGADVTPVGEMALEDVNKDKKFRDQRIALDGRVFLSCTFERCTLVYSGGELPTIGDSKFGIGTQFEFADAALRTVSVMRSWYHGGMSKVVDDVFKSIREKPTAA